MRERDMGAPPGNKDAVPGDLRPRRVNREQLGEIARLIDEGRLRPVVDAEFPLAQARRAYEHRATRGKVVLAVAG